MATVLGKRKSRTQKPEPSISPDEAQAIFQRHFEAQFAPLDLSTTTKKQPSSSTAPETEDLDTDASEDSWDGLSGASSDSDSETESETSTPNDTAGENVEVVEVVSHTSAIPTTTPTLSKRELKAYLSSRPPPTTDPTPSTNPSTSSKRQPQPTPDEDAPSLLKNDLALQRLLSESHLLARARGAGGTEHQGRNRHLATDLRLAALGSRSSIYAQAKMPMAQRKGIASAAAAREGKRRREARENGIVLERPGAGASSTGYKSKSKSRNGGKGRERAVDAPAVGKLRNGMLKLSKRDIASIQEDGAGAGRRGGKGGAGKRRR
ncbi:hypothetical protein F5B20DRAFT_29249 [Whalleya microplaca]|nr:hypothetical protein F5B20DRAFT_29249 [Whalleya microplaca]